MPTDKTPRDADETLALPVTDSGPTTNADDDTTVIATDETTILPTVQSEPSTDDTTVLPTGHSDPSTDDTTVLPTGHSDPSTDDTTVLPAEDLTPAADDTAVITSDRAPTPPGADETRPYPTTTAWSQQPNESQAVDEPPAYTSPIGALYTPTDRPDPAPTDRPADHTAERASDPVVEPAPADPPRRRLRVGTVVWGLVIAAIGVGLLAWAAGFAIDLQLAMIVLLAVAGTALLVGSIVSGARAARR